MLPLDAFGAFVGLARNPGHGDGPLAGLRIAVKDNISVAGLPFTAGHPLFIDRCAGSDAEAVRRLRLAGACIVGVTRTDAGGFGVTTPDVENPIAGAKTVGGSSGGSAAAVAAGLADVALGTDTGGSVRIPAACTGLIGFKPTLDAISTAGTWPLSQTLDHVGVIGRHLRDVERTADILLDLPQAGPDDERSIRRIGVDWTLLHHCDAEVRATFEQVTTHCRSAGFEIVPIALPGPDAILEAHRTVLLADATNVYRSYVIDRLADLAQRSLALAAKIAGDEIDDAHAAISATRTAVETLFNQVDLILTPTLRCPVPAKGACQIDIQGKPTSVIAALISFTAPFNASGHPALALPTTTTLHGIPFSVQLVGPLGADRWLLRSVRALARLALNPHLDE